jgi:hypothetical protein
MHFSKNKKAEGAEGITFFVTTIILILFMIIVIAIVRLDVFNSGKSKENIPIIQSYSSDRFIISFFNTRTEGGTMYDLLMRSYFSSSNDYSEFRAKAEELLEKTYNEKKCFQVYINGIKVSESLGFFSCKNDIEDSKVTLPAYGLDLELRLTVGNK